MAVTVQCTDGRSIEFPDGTPRHVIESESDRIFGEVYRDKSGMSEWEDITPASRRKANSDKYHAAPVMDGDWEDVTPEGRRPAGMPAPRRRTSMSESLLRGAVEGATFGFDGKLGSEQWKADRETSKRENPGTHFVGEMIGSLATMPLVGPAGVLARGGQAVAKVAPRVGNAIEATSAATGAVLNPSHTTSLTGAIAQGSKVGATHGALSGLGHTETPDGAGLADQALEYGSNAIKSGAIGAVVGAPLGALGHGVGRIVQNVAGARAAARAETDDAGQGALRTIQRGFERDQIPLDTVEQAIRRDLPDTTSVAGNRRRFGPSNARQDVTDDIVERISEMAYAGHSPRDISVALRREGVPIGPDAVETLVTEFNARHSPLNLVDRAGMVRPGSGENVQWTMRAAANTPGPARAQARESLVERQIGAGPRVQGALERTVGSSDFDGVAARHAEDLSRAGDEAYKLA